MNQTLSVRRALTFIVPVLLIAALTWYLVGSAPRGAATIAAAEPSQVVAPPAWPPAGPYHAATTGPEQVELCGHGPVPVDAVPRDLEQAADAAVRHRAEALQRSASASDRMLGFATAAMLASAQARGRAFDADPECATRAACLDKVRLDAARAAVAPVEGLARLAVTSRDPSVYGIAFAACRMVAPAPEINVCSALRAEQWTLLDPDNGQAWLEVARAAAQRKDVRSVDEAMQRASRGRSLQYPVPPFHELLAAQPRPADAIEALTTQRVLDIYGRWLALVLDRGVAHSYCAKETINEPGRRAACSELATSFVEREGTLVGIVTGANIGETAGWSAERAASHRTRAHALNDALSRHLPGTDLLTCDGAARARTWLTDVQRAGGEAAYARRALAGTDTAQARR